MRIKFSREVRKSIADELKKISTFGGIALVCWATRWPTP